MYGPLQLHSLRLCWYLFINQCFMIDHPFLQALSISWFSNILPIIGDSYTLIFFAPAMSPAWCQHWRQSNRIIDSCRQGPHLGWKTPMHFSLLRSLAFSSFVLEICPTIVNCTQPLKKKTSTPGFCMKHHTTDQPQNCIWNSYPNPIEPLKITLSHLMKD